MYKTVEMHIKDVRDAQRDIRHWEFLVEEVVAVHVIQPSTKSFENVSDLFLGDREIQKSRASRV